MKMRKSRAARFHTLTRILKADMVIHIADRGYRNSDNRINQLADSMVNRLLCDIEAETRAGTIIIAKR